MDKKGEGGGGVKCPRMSTRGGERVEIGQNLVHVVVECPLIRTGHIRPAAEFWVNFKN